MHKGNNFIARLLNRCTSEEEAGHDLGSQDGIITNAPIEVPEAGDGDAPAIATQEGQPDDEPTICKGGKKYRARLRGGRWETFGAPIGDC